MSLLLTINTPYTTDNLTCLTDISLWPRFSLIKVLVTKFLQMVKIAIYGY